MLNDGFRVCSLVFTLAVLTACGGGGGGSSNGSEDTVPDDDPVDTGPYNVSGQVTVPSFTFVDADTSDTAGGVLVEENNIFSRAQRVPNPSVVGGYVSSSSGTYPDSSFQYYADDTDIYLTTLITGQQVTITAFDADSAFSTLINVELFEESDEVNPVESEVLMGDMSTTFTIASSGNFYIKLTNANGPSNYLLTIASDSNIAALQTEEKAEFVAGEAIIKYRPEWATSAVEDKPLPGYFLARMNDEGTKGLFRFSEDAASGTRRLAQMSRTEQRQLTLDNIKSLRSRPDIEYAEPNYIRRAYEVTPDDPEYVRQWHYPQINLPTAWDVSTGSGTVVAVLDTGVLLTHPDLSSQILKNGSSVVGFDFVSSVSLSNDGDGIDSDPTDPGDSRFGESSFHGTHVAGTVAAADNSVGGVGVAYGAKIMPVRVLGLEGSGTDADLVQAIRYAAQLSNSSGTLPTQRADVINMSLGGPGLSTSLGQAVSDAIAAGVIVVAAAGNENTNAPSYPAAYPGVISVSATDRDNLKAPYSNFGSTVDVAAPGGNMSSSFSNGVFSTWGNDSSGSVVMSYAYFQGTSMASPHVAGVIAMMKEITDTLDSSDINNLLQSGELTVDIGATGRDDLYGYGLIDAAKAMTAAGASIFPSLSADSSNLTFTNSGTQSITLTIPAGVTGIVESETSEGGAWLSVIEAGAMDGTTYDVVVDDTGLADGVSYPGSVIFDYTSTLQEPPMNSEPKSLSIPVTLVLDDPSDSPDAGRHYILLVDEASVAETQGTVDVDVYQAVADAVSGVYQFTVTDVPEGIYVLVAGSDIDDDGFICDEGEACGYYPVIGQPDSIEVTADRSGLSFATNFSNGVSSAGLGANTPAEGYPHH